MTASDLTVYGKRIGSLFDRRIGGRYELVEITDTGGTGMSVKLRRVDGGQLLTVSVYNLGLNYVCVPEKAEPAEDVTCDCQSETVDPSDVREWATRPTHNAFDHQFGDRILLNGVMHRVVDADGKAILEREPAPTPLLPWEEPDAAPYWRHRPGGGVVLSRHMPSDLTPAVWQGGYFIPADLIERARAYRNRANKGYELGSSVIDAILDAAEATS